MNNTDLILHYVKEHSVKSSAQQGNLVFEVKDKNNLSPLCIAHFHLCYDPFALEVYVFLDSESIDQLCSEEEAAHYRKFNNFPDGEALSSCRWEWDDGVTPTDVLTFLRQDRLSQ